MNTSKTQTVEGNLVTAFREKFQQACRNAVLAALDSTAEELLHCRSEGWKDCELPALFATIDLQAKNIMLRQARFVNDLALHQQAPARDLCPHCQAST